MAWAFSGSAEAFFGSGVSGSHSNRRSRGGDSLVPDVLPAQHGNTWHQRAETATGCLQARDLPHAI